MSEATLPNIEHASVTLNEYGRVVIRMDAGWVFWDRNDYRDENGEVYDPPAEWICYSRYGVFSPQYDFSGFVVAAESEVPADQIFGKGNEVI